jgi:hypothetical protein
MAASIPAILTAAKFIQLAVDDGKTEGTFGSRRFEMYLAVYKIANKKQAKSHTYGASSRSDYGYASTPNPENLIPIVFVIDGRSKDVRVGQIFEKLFYSVESLFRWAAHSGAEAALTNRIVDELGKARYMAVYDAAPGAKLDDIRKDFGDQCILATQSSYHVWTGLTNESLEQALFPVAWRDDAWRQVSLKKGYAALRLTSNVKGDIRYV